MNKSEAKILLVEDEPNLQFLFEKQLKVLGYQVSDVADDGLSAMSKVLEVPYHLVFMDIRLKGIDGVEITQRIRKTERQRGIHTPIIGMTAFGNRELCVEAGMDDFLQKPVMLQQLRETIDRWLGSGAPNQKSLTDPGSLERIEENHDCRETDDQLNAIHQRIVDLRKRAGLDDTSN